MIDAVLTAFSQKVEAAIDHFKQELSSIRAGRANPSMIENVPVEAYGARMKLMEVGTISAPQPTLLTIQVWDGGLINSVVKAIQEANLGLNPANDGQIIRLAIPALTQERREEFVKLVRQKLENIRIQIRQLRHEQREIWKNDEEVSEDELERREKLLQDLIERKTGEIEDLAQNREQELMEV